MSDLVSLIKTYEKSEAENIRALLEMNKIEYDIAFARSNMQVSMGIQSSDYIEIFVNENDFPKAWDIVKSIIEKI